MQRLLNTLVALFRGHISTETVNRNNEIELAKKQPNTQISMKQEKARL